MKKSSLIISILFSGCLGMALPLNAAGPATEAGQPHDLGIGAVFGEPTGFTAKYWLTDQAAVDTDLAYHFGDNDGFQWNMDYLWHMPVEQFNNPYGRVPVYFGAGLKVLATSDAEAGIRFPLGIDYLWKKAPLEFFAEIVPVLEFAPDTDGELDGGVGLRIYFK